MKQAWKEYAEICKLSGKWIIKHWKGYTLFCIIYCVLVYGYYTRFYDIKEWFKSKFRKTEIES
jgi:hypothetical protein